MRTAFLFVCATVAALGCGSTDAANQEAADTPPLPAPFDSGSNASPDASDGGAPDGADEAGASPVTVAFAPAANSYVSVTGASASASGAVAVVGTLLPSDPGGGFVNIAGVQLGAGATPSSFVALLDAAGKLRFGRTLPKVSVTSVAIAPNDDVVIAGLFHSLEPAADLGMGPLSGAGDWDAFVARYAPDGTPRWTRTYGSTGDDRALAVVVGAGGESVVTGYVSPGIDFGAGASTWGGIQAAFLLKLDGAGVRVASTITGGTSPSLSEGQTIAIDTDGSVVVGGYLSGHSDFGAGPINGALCEAFVGKWTSGLAPAWVRHYVTTGAGVSTVRKVVFDQDGPLALGWFRDRITVPSGTILSQDQQTIAGGTPTYFADVFLLGLDRQGNFRHLRAHGTVGDDRGGSLFVAPGRPAVWSSGFKGQTEYDLGFGRVIAPPTFSSLFAVDVLPAGGLGLRRNDADLAGRELLALRPGGGAVLRTAAALLLTTTPF